MTGKIRIWIAAAAVTVVLGLCAGCATDESVASPATKNAAMQTAPSFSDVNRALKLNDPDAAVVKQALAEWQRSAASNPSNPGVAARRDEMEFIATVTPSLDDTQLASLVSLLVARRESNRGDMRARHAGTRNGEAMKAMSTELGLTEKQQDALKTLHKDTRTKAQAQFDAFDKGAITEDQMHDALGKIREDAHTQMATILSADQMKKLDAMRDDRFENRMGRRVDNADKRGDMRLAWLTRTLVLTDAQASQAQTALTKLSGAQEATFKSVQSGSLTREQAQQQMRSARDAFSDNLKSILTAPQESRMEILKPLLPGQIHHA
jgi:hypothetical protein